ncbi:MAG: SDR family oxidoreductase [Fibrobacteres bacterium]|nr:SDR family oxidoreductase [Fibrobacterota bacterium]
MEQHKNGEVVVITGGTAGVGRAVARRFAVAGASVAVIARGKDRLDATLAELQALGVRALALQADVADAAAVEAAAERVEKELGPIDIWVNNAMTSVFSPVWEMKPEEYARVTQVTYLGFVHGALAALRRMRPRDRGTIVLVGSALAYRGIPLQSAYCASKHAIQGFMDSLRSELLHVGSRVHVCMVNLPAVNTPQFAWVKSRLPNKAQPVPPIYQPEVPAEAIYRAAHSRRREWLIGWPTYRAIWGNYIAPGFADRVLAKMGFSSQQGGQAEDPGRPDNLWSPPPGDYGCHGSFDALAHDRSPLLWLSRFRARIGLGLLGAASALALAMGRRRRAAR